MNKLRKLSKEMGMNFNIIAELNKKIDKHLGYFYNLGFKKEELLLKLDSKMCESIFGVYQNKAPFNEYNGIKTQITLKLGTDIIVIPIELEKAKFVTETKMKEILEKLKLEFETENKQIVKYISVQSYQTEKGTYPIFKVDLELIQSFINIP